MYTSFRERKKEKCPSHVPLFSLQQAGFILKKKNNALQKQSSVYILQPARNIYKSYKKKQQ